MFKVAVRQTTVTPKPMTTNSCLVEGVVWEVFGDIVTDGVVIHGVLAFDVRVIKKFRVAYGNALSNIVRMH